MPSDRARVAALLAGLLLLGGCSRRGEIELFPAETAQDVARRFHAALVGASMPELVRLSKLPFRYKSPDREWPDVASFQANLTKELPRFRHLLAGLDRVEVFSRSDLLDGRWPRQRKVAEDERAREIQALGIEEYGWLARIHAEGRPGYVLVLNAQGASRLLVQMLDI